MISRIIERIVEMMRFENKERSKSELPPALSSFSRDSFLTEENTAGFETSALLVASHDHRYSVIQRYLAAIFNAAIAF